jgi:hypothetical protein
VWKEIFPIPFQTDIVAALFDYFIRLKKDLFGNIQADGARGFQIESQVQLKRLLDR